MNFSGVKVPCQNCGSRYLGCHSKCGTYSEYRAKIDEIHNIRVAKYNEYRDVLHVMNNMTKARVYGGI